MNAPLTRQASAWVYQGVWVVIETAGGGGSGPHPQLEQSNHVGLLQGVEAPTVLREQIMERVRASRSAGLGDEHDTTLDLAGSPASWSPAHLEALREIAAHVARLRARSGRTEPDRSLHDS